MLRERVTSGDVEGLCDKDIERGKILLERDERKRQKKTIAKGRKDKKVKKGKTGQVKQSL